MAEEDSNVFDLIIIGAGLYGIQAARTYLELHPYDKIVIFESGSSVGGVWSAERMYDAFWTQTPLSMAEFSDMPLAGVPAKEQCFDFFPARYVTKYLEQYVGGHRYNGITIRDRIKFNACVEKLEKLNNSWTIKIKELPLLYQACRVVDASGLTSRPYIPQIPGKDTFQALTIHHKDFGRSQILTRSKYSHVVVIGGAKSAADVAYAAAKVGKQVTWIIRKTGSGPAAFAPAEGLGTYNNANEMFFNRLTSSFLASIYTEKRWWTPFLYTTRFGIALFKRIWARINAKVADVAEYDRPEGSSNGFRHLRPDTSLFWQNDSSGINQRPDFFETIATKVQVYRQDVVRMTETQLMLADGTAVTADAVVFATGWDITVPYLDSSAATQLGLPTGKSAQNPADAAEWEGLERRSDVEILQRFPVLADPPPHYSSEPSLSPLRLYKGMLPLQDHSIIFLGRLNMGNHFRNAEVQALWTVAALNGNVPLPSIQLMKKDIASVIAWCKRRYLGKGQLGNWLYWDLVPYTDMLLQQLGLSSHRKGWGKDLFAPCMAQDLRELLEEYKQRHSHKHLDDAATQAR